MPSPLLVFDLDGTLADTAPDLLATLDEILPRHGFRSEIDPDFREGIGHGARSLIEYALARQGIAVDARKLDQIFADFLTHYEANICVKTRLFPGALPLLDRFARSGWEFAVCTNKPVRMSRLLLARLGITERFAAVCGGDSFPYKKPDPAHLLDTIAAARGAREKAVMVGDSRTDLDTARGANVPFIGVTFGYTPTPMATLGPDVLVESFDAIQPKETAALLDGRSGEGRSARAPAPATP
jgi:phosphoglycolate phosphatase